MDGCRDNIVRLSALIRSWYHSHKSVFTAVFSITKAFDSMETSAIITTAAAAGLTPPLVEYFREVYAAPTTTLFGEGWCSVPLKVTRRVKQGEPHLTGPL